MSPLFQRFPRISKPRPFPFSETIGRLRPPLDTLTDKTVLAGSEEKEEFTLLFWRSSLKTSRHSGAVQNSKILGSSSEISVWVCPDVEEVSAVG